MLAVRGAALILAAAGLAGTSPAKACEPTKVRGVLVEELRLGHTVDVHHLARALTLVCDESPTHDEWRIYDALALMELDEVGRARQLLGDVGRSPDPDLRRRAGVLLSFTHLAQGDAAAFETSLRALDARDRARLSLLAAADDTDRFAAALAAWPTPETRTRLADLGQTYDDARTLRRPWLAGTLSAVLPGAGQVYAGSFQAAAVAFVLNAVFITATVELGRREMWAAATATGLGASFVYLGNILNAADLARRRSETAAAPVREELERILVPERRPWLER